MEKKDSTKVGFRMWKSGKRWLFSGIALAATLMIGTSAISADVNVDGAATDHKDICLTVHDLHDENEDENQCAFWYKEEPTDKGPHRDEEIIPPFGGGPGGSTWHGGVHVETGGRATPTDKGPHRDEEIIPPFGGGPGGSTWHGGVHVETGGRATPTDKGPHRDEEIIPPFGGGPGGSTWHGGVHVETGGRATPTDKGPHRDEEIIPPFGGGPGGSTWHGGVHVETGGRATPTDKGPHRDEEIIPPFGGGPGGSTWQSKSTSTSPVTVLSATGVTTLIAVGAFSIKKIWKK